MVAKLRQSSSRRLLFLLEELVVAKLVEAVAVAVEAVGAAGHCKLATLT